ncbi:MAG: hypothetical protein RR942_08705 [Romboutsia sp.]
MKKPLKLVFVSLATILSLNLGSLSIFADSLELKGVNIIEEYSTPIIKELNPEDLTLFGLDPPSSTSVQNLNSGQLSFSGSAEISTLYTNKCFTGKSTISYNIKSTSSKKLTAKIYTSNGLFASKTLTVNPSSSASGKITGLDSTKKYYISFSASSNFSGYVK